jgi:hypothetical protein
MCVQGYVYTGSQVYPYVYTLGVACLAHARDTHLGGVLFNYSIRAEGNIVVRDKNRAWGTGT